MTVAWNDYLKVPNTTEEFCRYRQQGRESFLQQRENIRRLIEALAPRTVACLGAGVLNDIPYQSLIRSEAMLHLVEWVPEMAETGVHLSVIQPDEEGEKAPSCVYCDPNVSCPEQYCTAFARTENSQAKVCEHYEPGSEITPTCAAFGRGEYPKIWCADVTGGYASAFGERINGELRKVRSWNDAFTKAIALAERLKSRRTNLGIAERSVDLVTSSMLVSQFDHEPYEYFSHRATDRLGTPTPGEERRLLPTMERLRSILLINQVERHCEEICRLLAPGGVCYMSFEMFRTVPDGAGWFLVEGMPRALEVVGRYFLFDFERIGENDCFARFETQGEPSLTYSFVLNPKQR